MEPKLTKFIKDNYPETKTDLFACFIDKGNSLTKPHGFNCMVTMQSWMFLSSFEKMRTRLLATKSISSLLHMDNMVMGIAFGTAVTNFRNSTIRDYKGTYNYIEVNDIENGIPKEFPVVGNRFAQVSTNNFSKIPGSPIAYWVSQKMLKVFEIGKRLGEISKPRQGMATTNNNRFLRLWHEVAVDNIGFDLNSIEDTIREQKWYPYNKGGDFRKWYGNNDYVVNFKNKGEEVCSYIDATSAVNSKGRVINREHYFHECISWSLVSSGNIAFRYKTNGYIFDVAGMSCFASHDMLIYLLGLNNTKVVRSLMATLAPTINYQAGDIANIPVIYKQEQFPHISNLVEENIQLERLDWDCFEISWDFTEHPLVRISKELWDVTKIDDAMQYYYGTHFRVNSPLELCYLLWQGECDERFKRVKVNEEELNRIFIDIYGLQDELTPEVADKDITVRKADLQRDIKSLLSYAVGCMFGRYSLDKSGIICADSNFDIRNYSTFKPDMDNCIPITDEEYLEDDIVGRFCEWLKVVFGAESLEANLAYIAEALGNKGTTSREVIRNYFLSDFMKDHIKIYQKRPIYWLFDSGKLDGFKALVYMHRWNADTVGNLRVEYLHKMQHTYEREIIRMQETIDNSRDSREVSKATKRKDKLQKQLKETKDYDAKMAHIALSRIEIDLDDGVKVNYEKVQAARDGKKMQILAKI